MPLSRTAHTDTFCRDNLPPPEHWPEFRFDLPELRYPDRLNCAKELLANTAADRPCLHTETATWTYADLRRGSDQIARLLTTDYGLLPGNRVLLRGPNNPWLVAAWFGVLKAGGVVVTTIPLLRAAELTALIELTRPALSICDDRFTEELRTADPTVPVLVYGGIGADDLVARSAAQDPCFDAVETAADDVALLAPTSGTTGKPKITMHFHRDVLAIADTFARHVLKAGPDDVFAGSPPIGFTFGLGGLVVFPLRVGASTLLLERTTPAALADAVRRHEVSVLVTAPTAYKAMLAAGKETAFSSVRRCVSAGEHLPTSVWNDFHAATGIKIIDGIGGTEMLHVFISAADEQIRPGATGRVVPGFTAAVLDEEGKPVGDGVPGRLAVKGPTGCRYLNDERQRSHVRAGWNITGDTYIRDADGYFWYQARNDDMIISSGYNIAGPEVESALLAHPDVAEAAVVAAPDEERGSIVLAYVVLGKGTDPGPERAAELQAFVKQRIAPYKYPRAVRFVGELPKTSNGKLQRYRLRELAAHSE